MLEVLNRTAARIASELNLERLLQMVTDVGVGITGAAFGAFFYNVLTDDAALDAALRANVRWHGRRPL